MIIFQPEVNNVDGSIVISSDVEVQSPSLASIEMPNKLWFSFPETYQDFISHQSDGFVASLILRAMVLGEDVEVRGTTSSRLAYGLEEFQAIFSAWLPRNLKKVGTTYQKLTSGSKPLSTHGVATAFSGGVDSFFTLFSHLPQNQLNSDYQITHGLFIHGFDVPLSNVELYNALWLRHRALFGDLGLTLLSAKTNIRQFYAHQLDWLYAHGGALIGTALVLGKLFRSFYVPSDYDYTHPVPLGISPLTDHLFSTENTQIIHHGASTSRSHKIDQIAKWQVTFTNLTVCSGPQKAKEHLNCGKCHKCVSTMMHLYVIDQLSNYAVFPKCNIFILCFRWFFNMGVDYEFLTTLIMRSFKVRKFWLVPFLLPVYLGGFYTDFMHKVKLITPYQIKYWIRECFGMV